MVKIIEKKGRGHGLVVINPYDGRIKFTETYDTHGDKNAGSRMRKDLSTMNSEDICVFCVWDEGSHSAESAYPVLYQYGGMKSIGWRASYILIGSKTNPSWTFCNSLPDGCGPLIHEMQLDLLPAPAKLQLGVCENFENIFKFNNSLIESMNFSIWKPKLDESQFEVGYYVCSGLSAPESAFILESPSADLICQPYTFERIWKFQNVACFRAICPEGFVSLGDVVVKGKHAEEESLEPSMFPKFVCVLENNCQKVQPAIPILASVGKCDEQRSRLWKQFGYFTHDGPLKCISTQGKQEALQLNPIDFEINEVQTKKDIEMENVKEKPVKAEKKKPVVNLSKARKSELKKLVKLYFMQITKGCGRSCNNDFCCSGNPGFTKMKPNDAAKEALRLAAKEGGKYLCKARVETHI